MTGRLVALALVAGLAVVASGCQDTPAPDTTPGPLAFQTAPAGATIPREYGRLVSVTSTDAYPGWAQMWFEKDDGTITAVFVNYQYGQTRDRVLVLPRS